MKWNWLLLTVGLFLVASGSAASASSRIATQPYTKREVIIAFKAEGFKMLAESKPNSSFSGIFFSDPKNQADTVIVFVCRDSAYASGFARGFKKELTKTPAGVGAAKRVFRKENVVVWVAGGTRAVKLTKRSLARLERR